MTIDLVKMLEDPQSRRKAIATVIALFVIFFGWNIFIKKDLKSLTLLAAHKKAALGQNQTLNQLIQTENKIRAYRARLTAENSWLIDKLNKITRESGVTLNSVNPQFVTEFQSFKETTMQIELQGDYHQLGDLVSLIENHTPFIKITSLKIDKAGLKGAETGLLKAKMAVSVYKASGELEPLMR